MAVERIFLDWNAPFLHRVVDFFLQHYPSENNLLDLRDLLVIFPTSRAERRFVELLVIAAEKEGKILLPPLRRTVGDLPEQLYQPALPIATPLQREIAWMSAIKEQLEVGLPNLVPASSSTKGLPALVSLARRLDNIWVELSSSGVSFKEAAKKAASLTTTESALRWEEMHRVHQCFLQNLNEQQLCDRYTERLKALENKTCISTSAILLLGTVDLRPITCAMLHQLDCAVKALIFAPEECSDLFDQTGCLITESWLEQELVLDCKSITFAENPPALGRLAISQLSSLTDFPSNEITLNEITFGLADEALCPYLIQAAHNAKISVHYAKGKPLLETPPGLLLSAIAEYLGSCNPGSRKVAGLTPALTTPKENNDTLFASNNPSFDSTAALIRHPDFERWIFEHSPAELQNCCLLSSFDYYYSRHLPADIVALPDSQKDNTAKIVLSVVDLITALLAPLQNGLKPLSSWPEIIIEILRSIYNGRSFNRDHPNDSLEFAALSTITELLEEAVGITDTKLTYSGRDALTLLLSQAATREVAPPSEQGRFIEALGWLDLPLDDAPALLIIGMNEGRLPQSVNSDPFLPNSLRKLIGLIDNDRRYIRDLYALTAIVNSRKKVAITVGQSSTANEPLLISRLLLSRKDETLAELVHSFYQTAPTRRLNSQRILSAPDKAQLSPLEMPPRPRTLQQPITIMTVTSFADYLRCPYRYYLQHVLRLSRIDDSALEMDGRLFGSLAHRILALFARSHLDTNILTAPEINDRLMQILKLGVDKLFGPAPRPAVTIQIEQLKQRLRAFANWQADWSKEGWQIKYVEWPFSEKSTYLKLSQNRTMGLRGRIDRIDYNPKINSWIAFDYKTGDYADSPEKQHLRGKTWVDLQLPLYHYSLQQNCLCESPALGFITISADAYTPVSHSIASWEKEQLDEAIAKACFVAESVVEQIFWPPREVASSVDEFAAICGQQRLFEAFEESSD